MFGGIIQPAGPAVGIATGTYDPIVIARGGNIAKGALCKFDLSGAGITADSLTPTYGFGTNTDVLANVSAVAAAADRFGYLYAIALEAISDQAKGRVRMFGYVDALANEAGWGANQKLYPHADGTLAPPIGGAVSGGSISSQGETQAITDGALPILGWSTAQVSANALGVVLFNGFGFPGSGVAA